MDRYRTLLFLTLLLMGSGCTPIVCEHPIVNPAEAKPCPELYGAYRFESAREEQKEDREFWLWHLGPAGENFPAGFLRLISLEFKDGLPHSSNGVLFAEKVGDAYIVHSAETGTAEQELISEASAWKPWSERWDTWKNGWDPDRVKFYHLMRFTLKKGNLHWGIMNTDFVISEIEAGRLSGEVTRSDDEENPQTTSVRITAETSELRAFVERHIAGNLFEDLDGGHFVRLANSDSP